MRMRIRGVVSQLAVVVLSAGVAWALPYTPNFNVPDGQSALFSVGNPPTRSCGHGFFSGTGTGTTVKNVQETVHDPALLALDLNVDSIFFRLGKTLFKRGAKTDEGTPFESDVKPGGTIKVNGDLDGYVENGSLLTAAAFAPNGAKFAGSFDILARNANQGPFTNSVLGGTQKVGLLETYLKITGGAIFDWLVDRNAPVHNGVIVGYLTALLNISTFNGKDYVGSGQLTFYAPSGSGTEIPEPATSALLLAGLAGAVRVRRRKHTLP